MKYTDQKSKTVYEDIEVEVPDGISYFNSWDTDNIPNEYFKLELIKDKRFDGAYDIKVTRIRNYDDNFYVIYKEYNEYELPISLRGYFCGREKKDIITEGEFNEIKTQIFEKL
jgi:hypothetical protein